MVPTYVPNPYLPRLAWLATVDRVAGCLRVEHGVDVETRDSLFFEGAWGGDWAEGRPDLTEVVFGSGGVIVGSEICFVSSVATTDYLFHCSDESSTWVSNSLALLLAELGDEMKSAGTDYARLNDAIMEGIHKYERDIPTRRGRVHRLMHHNLLVGSRGGTECGKPMPPEFPEFETYAAYLSASYQALAANARDPRRATPLRIYSTQSKGYDSTAINAIAAPHGLDGVFTITRGKGPGAIADLVDEPEVSDDGTEIAQILGVGPVIPLERRAFHRDFSDEVRYHAGIHECQDANLKQVVDHIRGPALLLTGTLGEMWYGSAFFAEHPTYYAGALARADLSCHGLGEVRLRAGYTQVPIPYLGARRSPEILAITESDAMSPWRLGRAYDRPIPRRIGESAGVPRNAFGQVKVGSVVQFMQPQIPYDATLRRQFLEQLVASGTCRRWQLTLLPVVRRLNTIFAGARETRNPALYYALRAVAKLRGRPVVHPIFWARLRGTLHAFAVNQCATEYRSALNRRP